MADGNDRVEQARMALGAYLAQHKLSQAEGAKLLGYSSGAVSQFLRGQYAGDTAEVCTRVEELVARERTRTALPQLASGAWRGTGIAEQVYGGLQWCHQRRRLGLITGDAGLGKTTALERYASEHRSALLLRADMTCARPHYLLRALGAALGARVPSDQYSAAIAVRDALRGTDRLVIIDEAQRLSAPALEAVRDLHDAAGVGVVLCGNQAVQAQVYGSGQAAFAQHFSRLGLHIAVTNDQITLGDVEMFAGEHIASNDSASRRYLLELTRRGGFRTMLFTLELALELHSAGPQTPFIEVLKAAQQQRGVAQ